jgi:hypothetical protein
LSSSRRNIPIASLISSASAFGPYVRYHQSPLSQKRLAHPDTPSPSK